MMKLKQQVKAELENGPKSFEQLSQAVFGCDCCNKVTQEEHDKVSSVVRELHRSEEVKYTVDRRVELASE